MVEAYAYNYQKKNKQLTKNKQVNNKKNKTQKYKNYK